MMLSAITQVSATGLSYIYIQGDKQIPFYVKVDGEMQPRYGKNYCILSKLAPGPLQIEVLFQQNEYPPEKFTVLVPEYGSRGFMLTRKDGVYALYDLQQGFYLSPGNKAEDDVAPLTKAPVPQLTEPVETSTTKPAVVATNTTENKPIQKKPEPIKPTKPKPEPKEVVRTEPKPVDNTQPKFIDNIELNNERTFGSAEETTTAENTLPTEKKALPVFNSDCPKPLPFSEYQDILEKARSKSDKNRLKYLFDQADKCYTTIQVRALTRTLEKDPERYAFLKQVFPRVTDQSNFSMLENTLQSKEWKEYFKLILP
jgi:hypothetical protein